MKITIILSLVCAFLSLSTIAFAKNRGSEEERKAMLNKHPTILKYINPAHSFNTRWKNSKLWDKFQLGGGSWHSKHSWKSITGPKDTILTAFFSDAFEVYKWNGQPQWVLQHIRFGHHKDTATGAFFHKVPKLADKLAATIDTPKKVNALWLNYSASPYWTLFYLGAKHKLPQMIKGLDGVKKSQLHLRAFYQFVSAWKLNKTQIKSLTTFCTTKVFVKPAYAKAKAHCLRWLGTVGTKDPTAIKFILSMANDRKRPVALEAMRTISRLNYSGAMRRLLQKKLTKAHQPARRLRWGGSPKATGGGTWSPNYFAPTAAIGLMGSGDAKATQAIKYWFGFDAKIRCNHQAVAKIFVGATLASAKAQKAIKPWLLWAYKKMLMLRKKDYRMPKTLYTASIALIQMGDKTGLKVVNEILDGSDRKAITQLLIGMGSDPSKLIGGYYNIVGKGFIPVGKGGFSVKDAKALLSKLKSRFSKWSRDTHKSNLLRAFTDLQTRIQIKMKNL
jgi:hypothetical protein